MGNYTPTDPNDEAPLLVKQRRSLDMMSAQLTHNLNLMIAEQEARVKSFAAQHPGTQQPLQWTQQPETSAKKTKRKEMNVHSTGYTAPSVTPPPTQQHRPAPQAEPPRQQQRQQPPPVPPQVGARPKLKKHDNTSVGTVPMIMIVLVIIMMLRACN